MSEMSEMSDEVSGPPASGVTVEEINAFLAAEFAGNGNQCESVGERSAVARLDTIRMNLRPGGIISGPTVFGVCDAALYYACFTVMGIEPMVLTSEMSIRFLRPARGAILRARADLNHAGRRSLIGTVIAWTEDPTKPVAAAQGTYVAPLRR